MLRLVVCIALPMLALGCTKVSGDGSGGTEEQLILRDTFEDCVLYVRTHRPAANGVTWGPTNNKCYAEFGMTGVSASATWETCQLTAAEMTNNGGQVVCTCTDPQTSANSCGQACVTATNNNALSSFVPNIPFDPVSEFGKDWEAIASPTQIRGMNGKWVCQAASMTGPVPEDLECHADDRELRVTWQWGDGSVDVPVRRAVVEVLDGTTVVGTKQVGQHITTVEASSEKADNKAVEAIDDIYGVSTNGWSFNAALPATIAFGLAAAESVSFVTIRNGVGLTNNHISDFELHYTNDPLPTLSSTWTAFTGVAVDSSVVGGSVTGARVTLTGQEDVVVSFDSTSVRGVRLTIHDTDGATDASVINEFFVGAAEPNLGEVIFTGLGKDKPYTVRVTTQYAAESGTFPEAVTAVPATCVLETCPTPTTVPRTCTAAPGDAANIPTNAKTCLTIKTATPNAASGFYQIDPEGDGTEVNAYCDMVTDGGGWTLAISQMNGLFTADIETYTGVTPATDTSGALQYYLHADLTCVATKVKAQNNKGQEYTFMMSEFVGWNGKLALNDDNVLMSYKNDADIGVIAGDHYPVSYHYDTSCGTTANLAGCSNNNPCWGSPGCSTAYSHGGMSVWDWNTADCVAQLDKRAHFGGTVKMEVTWANRGTYLWIK